MSGKGMVRYTEGSHSMENAILIFVLALILGGAIAYIVRAKRRGVKCIGCSASGCYGGKKGSCNGCQGDCGCHEEKKEEY